MKEFKVEILLNSDDIAESLLNLDHEQAIEMICKIDLHHADAGFTEEIIKRLTQSLKLDWAHSPEDIVLPFINWDLVPDAEKSE